MKMREGRSQHQHRVEEFMEKAGQTVRQKPSIPTNEERVRMAKLILEEALETIEALGVLVAAVRGTPKESIPTSAPALGIVLVDPLDQLIAGCLHFRITPEAKVDLEKVVDGCCDLKVVTTCTLSGCGVADLEPQRRIDEANLRKFEPPKCRECGSEMKWVTANPVAREWVCTVNSQHPTRTKEEGPYRREDGKHVKPPYWNPPKLDDLV